MTSQTKSGDRIQEGAPPWAPAPPEQGPVARFETGIVKLLTPGPLHSSLTATGVFLVATAAIAATVLWLGPYRITLYPDDTAHMLTQGDYLCRGMRPYVDYYSMHGPAPFVFSAIAIAIAGVSLHAVILTQVMGAVALGSLVFLATRNRLHGALAVGLSVMAELLLVSCSPIGELSYREFSCAMWYNTIGYVLQAIVFTHLLVPPRDGSGAWRLIESLAMAVTLAFAFCTKATFFAPLLVLYVFGGLLWPHRRQPRSHACGVLLLTAALILGVFAIFGGSLEGYFGFLDAMSIKVHPLMLLLRYVHYTRTLGFCFLALAVVVWIASKAGVVKRVRRELVMAPLMVGAVLLGVSTACQDQEFLPLIGVVPLGLLIAVAHRAAETERPINQQLSVVAVALAVLLLIHAPKNSALSLAFSHMAVPTLTEATPPGEAPARGAAPNVDTAFLEYMPKAWGDHKQTGINLLQKHVPDQDQPVFVSTFCPVLPMMTGRPHAKGQVAWWPLEYADKPSDFPLLQSDLLSDAGVLLRDRERDRVWDYLQHWRGDYIEENFALVEETEKWQIYLRKSLAESSSDS